MEAWLAKLKDVMRYVETGQRMTFSKASDLMMNLLVSRLVLEPNRQ